MKQEHTKPGHSAPENSERDEPALLKQRWAREYGLESRSSDASPEFEEAIARIKARALDIPQSHPQLGLLKSMPRFAPWAVLAVAASLAVWLGLEIFNRLEDDRSPDWSVLETVGTEALMLELESTVVFEAAEEVGLDPEADEDWEIDESELEPGFWNEAEGLILDI
jgi:hypothetical protein